MSASTAQKIEQFGVKDLLGLPETIGTPIEEVKDDSENDDLD